MSMPEIYVEENEQANYTKNTGVLRIKKNAGLHQDNPISQTKVIKRNSTSRSRKLKRASTPVCMSVLGKARSGNRWPSPQKMQVRTWAQSNGGRSLPIGKESPLPGVAAVQRGKTGSLNAFTKHRNSTGYPKARKA